MDANVVLNGSEMNNYTLGITRDIQLCTPGQRATITMARTAPHTTISPGQTAVIKENGVLVLTGYVDSVRASRPPAQVEVMVSDKFKLARDYFLPDEIETTGETVSYWFGYLCNLVGLPYSIDSSGSSSLSLPMVEVQLGTRPVADALNSIAAYARWVMRVEPDGMLKAFVPTKSLTADHNFNNGQLEGEHEESDSDTRTTVKIYGFNAETGGVLLSKTRPVAGVPDRNMVFAHPAIDTLARAETMADAALDQFASLKEDCKVTIIGNPNVQVGETGVATVLRYSFIQWITSLHSELSISGYSMNVGLGRKCFRLPDFGFRRRLSSGSIGFAMTSGSIGRTYSMMSSGSTVWANITGAVAGVIGDGSLLRDDQSNGVVITGDGFYRSRNLFAPSPTWTKVYTAAQFNAATGKTWSRGKMIRQAYDSSGSQTFFAQVVTSGSELYVGRTLDAGDSFTWAYVTSPIVPNIVLGLESDPDDPNILFTSGSMGSLFKSTNAMGGLTFTKTYQLPSTGYISNVAKESGILGSSGSSTSGSEMVYIAGTLGMVNEWAKVYTFITPDGFSPILAIVKTGTDGRLAVMVRATAVGSEDYGAISSDYGDTFAIGSAVAPTSTNYFATLLYVSGDTTVIGLVGGAHTFITYRSTDAGKNYSAADDLGDDRQVQDMCMHGAYAYLASSEGTPFAGTIFRSINDGQTWDFIYYNNETSGYFNDVESNGAYIIGRTNSKRVFRSSSGDSGSWSEVAQPFATPGTVVSAGGYFLQNVTSGSTGLYRSIDGASWTRIHDNLPNIFSTGGNIYYQDASKDVYVSEDYGATFAYHSHASVSLSYLTDIGGGTLVGANGYDLYRFTDPMGNAFIKRSADAGVTFTDITPFQGGAYYKDTLAVDIYQPGAVRAIVGRTTLLMVVAATVNRGANWSSSSGSTISAGSSTMWMGTALALWPYDWTQMWAFERSKIRYSDDGGYVLGDVTGNWATMFGAITGLGIKILPVWIEPI